MRRRAAERWARAATRWLSAPAAERHRDLRVLLLWAGAESALHLLPLPTVCRLFGVRLTSPSDEPHSGGAAPLSAEIQERASRTLGHVERVLRTARPDAACLRRSLVIGHLLRDLRPVLRIGVRRPVEGLRAHAWLEIDRVAVAEPASVGGDFIPLRRLG